MMDKVKLYSQYIIEFLEEKAKIKLANVADTVETQVIADTKSHHYQLMRVGWNKKEFAHYSVFHFDIKDGKIWIQQNNIQMIWLDMLHV